MLHSRLDEYSEMRSSLPVKSQSPLVNGRKKTRNLATANRTR